MQLFCSKVHRRRAPNDLGARSEWVSARVSSPRSFLAASTPHLVRGLMNFVAGATLR
jgi:hypothetical protein